MAKLNQIIAVEKGAKSTTENEITRAYHMIQKAELFNGLSRVYTPKNEDGEELPPEKTNVIVSVNELVQAFSGSLTSLFDVTATKVYANTGARADVKVDDEVLLEQVPVEYLLFLEKRLADCLLFLGKLPTLDPAFNWEWDQEAGVFKSEKELRNRTKKVMRNHVKAKATDKHAEQVEVYTEDETVGSWETTKFSGAVPVTQVREWKDKVIKLQAAVKFAREEANSIEVTNQAVGEKVFSYLFNGLHA
jgi:hypothetical protein